MKFPVTFQPPVFVRGRMFVAVLDADREWTLFDSVSLTETGKENWNRGVIDLVRAGNAYFHLTGKQPGEET